MPILSHGKNKNVVKPYLICGRKLYKKEKAIYFMGLK